MSSRRGVGGSLKGDGPDDCTPELINNGSSSMVPHVIISGSSPIMDMLGEGVEETKLNPATLGVSVTLLPFISIVIKYLKF